MSEKNRERERVTHDLLHISTVSPTDMTCQMFLMISCVSYRDLNNITLALRLALSIMETQTDQCQNPLTVTSSSRDILWYLQRGIPRCLVVDVT